MKMLIGGKQVDSMSKKVFSNINPYDKSEVCTVPAGEIEDFEKAGIIAKDAQVSWESIPLYQRAQTIYTFISLVKENLEDIAQVMCAEGGKVLNECRGELECLCIVFKAYTEAACHFYGHVIPLNAEPRTENDLIFTMREPLGVFVTITPFNFPVELYAHKVAPALITGNAVIIKPASDTPKSAFMLTELLYKAGVPGGAVQLITGSGRKVGAWLKETKTVDAISFTGSTNVGMELMRNGANNLQRVFLELGGNDPYVVFADADLELAVSEAAGGRCWNSGQTCCANKRFIIENSIKDQFTKMLIEKLKEFPMGNPADKCNLMGPLVSENAAIEAENQVEFTIKQGAKCVLGGKRNGAFFPATVLVDITRNMDVMKDLEIFAPVFPIVGFNTFDEAVGIANSTCYGLASGVMTSDMKKAMNFAKAIKAGTCVIGGTSNYRSVHQPFGGYKHSGIGREGTGQTLFEVTQEKTVVMKKIFDEKR